MERQRDGGRYRAHAFVSDARDRGCGSVYVSMCLFSESVQLRSINAQIHVEMCTHACSNMRQQTYPIGPLQEMPVLNVSTGPLVEAP